MVHRREAGSRGKDWEFGISKCKLLQIEWKNIKVLLYSKGNYIQYSMTKHNGKEKFIKLKWTSRRIDIKQTLIWGFPGDSLVKNLPAML